MIIEDQIPSLLGESIPEFELVPHKEPSANNVYQLVHQFTHFTARMIHDDQPETLCRCFETADRFLRQGNHCVHNAVSNVFLYGLSNALAGEDDTRERIMTLMPSTLQKELNAQYYNAYP